MRHGDKHACTHNISVATLNISKLSILDLEKIQMLQNFYSKLSYRRILPTSGCNISTLDGFFKNRFSQNDYLHPLLLKPALSMPLLHARSCRICFLSLLKNPIFCDSSVGKRCLMYIGTNGISGVYLGSTLALGSNRVWSRSPEAPTKNFWSTHKGEAPASAPTRKARQKIFGDGALRKWSALVALQAPTCSTHSVMLKYGSKGALLPHFCLQARKKLRLRALTLGSQKTGSFELRLMAPAPSPW
ncbi:hypothetical protein ACFE04_008294 [Oxalis oulophora]